MSTATRSRNGIAGSSTWIVLAAVVVVGLVLIVGVKLIDSRLSSLEDRFTQKPPVVHAPSAAGDGAALSEEGRAVYVPVYSHIYTLGSKPMLLETTLSVRNTDVSRSLTVVSVRYFDTDGREVRSYLDEPLSMGPLATAEFLVEARDTSGGSGANFIVEWSGDEGINPPVIEAVMVGVDGTQGMSFASQGREISR